MNQIRTNVYSIVYNENETGATYTLRMAHPKVPDLVISQPPGRMDEVFNAAMGAFIKTSAQEAISKVTPVISEINVDTSKSTAEKTLSWLQQELTDVIRRINEGDVVSKSAIANRLENLIAISKV